MSDLRVETSSCYSRVRKYTTEFYTKSHKSQTVKSPLGRVQIKADWFQAAHIVLNINILNFSYRRQIQSSCRSTSNISAMIFFSSNCSTDIEIFVIFPLPTLLAFKVNRTEEAEEHCIITDRFRRPNLFDFLFDLLQFARFSWNFFNLFLNFMVLFEFSKNFHRKFPEIS